MTHRLFGCCVCWLNVSNAMLNLIKKKKKILWIPDSFFFRYLIKNESISWQKLNEMNAMTHPHPFASFEPKKYVRHILSIKKHVSLTDLNLCITLISATSMHWEILFLYLWIIGTEAMHCPGEWMKSCTFNWLYGSKGSGSTVGTMEQLYPVYRILSIVPSSMPSRHVQYSSQNISSTFFPKFFEFQKSCWNQGQVTSLDFKMGFLAKSGILNLRHFMCCINLLTRPPDGTVPKSFVFILCIHLVKSHKRVY